jgi:hypothetical protein
VPRLLRSHEESRGSMASHAQSDHEPGDRRHRPLPVSAHGQVDSEITACTVMSGQHRF